MADFTVDQTKDAFMKAQGAAASRAAIGADFFVNIAEDFSDVDPTGNNDSTVGMQAAIDQIFAAGATGYLRNGTYKIAPTEFNARTNSFLTLDRVNYDGGYPIHQEKVLRIVGEQRGWFNPTGGGFGGVIIDSRDAPAGTGVQPAIFAPEPYVNVTNNTTQLSYASIQFSNMLFMAGVDPSITALHLSTCTGVSLDNVSVTADYVAKYGSFEAEEPTHAETVGIYLPQILNNTDIILRRCRSDGFYNGIILSEHAELYDVFVCHCKDGLVIRSGDRGPCGTIRIEQCHTPVRVVGTTYMDLTAFVEIWDDVGRWYSDGDGRTELVDSGDLACGFLKYLGHLAPGGGKRALITSGFSATKRLNLATGQEESDPSGPVIVDDSFTAANGTTLSGRTPSPTNTPGNTITVVAGTWTIQGNRARQSVQDDAEKICSYDTEISDMAVSSPVIVPAGGFSAGVLARYSDSSNWILGYIDSDGNAVIYANQAGVGGALSTSGGNTFAAGARTVRLTCLGGEVRLYVDGILKTQTTTSFNQNATQAGLYVFAAGAFSNQEFESFTVESLA